MLKFYATGARFTKYPTTVLRQCQSYDLLTADVQFTKHLTKGAGVFLGTVHLQNRKIV